MNRIFRFIGLLAFYVSDVLKSNFRVAFDVLTPRHRMKPGIIAVNVADMTDRQTVIMANLITMTPGTLCLTVSQDRKVLYIHCMYVDGSPEQAARDLEQNYGKRVCDVF